MRREAVRRAEARQAPAHGVQPGRAPRAVWPRFPQHAAEIAAKRLGVVAVAVALAVGGAACSKDKGKDAARTTSTTQAGPRKPVVQLRVVTGTPSDCGALPADPDPAQPYNVLFTNQCIALAPAGMVITRAEVTAMVDGQSGADLTAIKLLGDDVARMAAFSQASVGKQVAFVAFGRVLATPQMQAAIPDGRVQIQGISKVDTARLQAALA